MSIDLDMELLDAVATEQSETIAALLRAGANPNAEHVLSRLTPLQIASAKGNLEIVKVLVAHGAKVTTTAGDAPTTALEVAAITGHVAVVKCLLENGALIPRDKAFLDDIRELGLVEILELFGDRDS